MGLVELILLAVGLAMDACAVSVGKGLNMPRVNMRGALALAVLFGGFQALMPTIGWAIGSQFLWLIAPVDHWVAFVLLAGIGIKMLWDVRRGGEEDGGTVDRIVWGEFLILAVATSIDALAAGVSFAALDVDIVFSVTLIGCTTFVLSLLGVFAGSKIGSKVGTAASYAGGIILILIGVKIVLEHTGILG